ncbi:MAG: hypothetical protein GY851_19685 [bacterium]|nr:hypothetical protein [bacterium]
MGCHERADTTPPAKTFPQAAHVHPVACMPSGVPFTYRAKFWNKGVLSDEGEARTRTVRAVNLIARY